MGIAFWVGAGVVAFAVARLVPAGRGGRWSLELIAAAAAGFAAGAIATALDFGGWREVDWRAGLFALLVAFAAIGATRLVSRRR